MSGCYGSSHEDRYFERQLNRYLDEEDEDEDEDEEDAEPSEQRYLNYYQCPYCGVEWEDEWDSMCNDKCPQCDTEIEPYQSDELTA